MRPLPAASWPSAADDAPPPRLAEDMLYCGLQGRALEASVRDLVEAGELPKRFAGFRVDARGVAVACAMRPPPAGGDICCPGPLSPGPALAFGATPLEFLRHAAGKGTAPASARAGSSGWSDLHADGDPDAFPRRTAGFGCWTDLRLGLLGCDGPPGSMTQVAAGAAFAFRRRGEASAALVFEERAALETGRWHEAMSFAAALRAPLIVVVAPVQGAPESALDLAAAGANYGLEVISLAGEPLARMHERAAEVRRRVVDGGGPALLDLGPSGAADWPGRDGDAWRRAERAAAAAVQSAVDRLAKEPRAPTAAALAPVLSGVPVRPHWTRSDPPSPSAGGPSPELPSAAPEPVGQARPRMQPAARPSPSSPSAAPHAG